MVSAKLALGLYAATSLVAGSPTPTLEKRATCTFTSAASAIASKKACSTIVLSNIAVPAGTTLDMTGLADGTHVRNLYLLHDALSDNH